MSKVWAVTIYNKATGELVDYASFNYEWEAVSYGRVITWADEKRLAYKVKMIC